MILAGRLGKREGSPVHKEVLSEGDKAGGAPREKRPFPGDERGAN